MNGVGNVVGSVVGNSALQADGQIELNGLHCDAHAADDVDRVGVRQRPDAHEYGGLAGKAYLRVIVFSAQHHITDILQTHDGAILITNH